MINIKEINKIRNKYSKQKEIYNMIMYRIIMYREQVDEAEKAVLKERENVQ